MILLNKVRQKAFHWQNLAKLLRKTELRLHNFQKMFANAKHFCPVVGLFPHYTQKFLRIDFVLVIRTLYRINFQAKVRQIEKAVAMMDEEAFACIHLAEE